MKRTLVASLVLGALSVLAFQPPRNAPLPNFDRRVENAAPIADRFAPEHQAGVDALKDRVADLRITRSKVLNKPVFFSSRSGFLTGPNAEGNAVLPAQARALPADDPHRAIKAFLNEHAALAGYDATALEGARVTRDYVTAHNGLRTVVWEQQLDGISVFDGITMGHITRNGELVNLYTHFVPDARGAAARGMKGRAVAAAAAAPSISALEALIAAAKNIGEDVPRETLAIKEEPKGAAQKQTFLGTGLLNGNQYAELFWLPENLNSLRLCWRVIFSSRTRGEMFMSLVDAETGEVVLRRCLTAHLTNVTYNVFTSDSPSPFSPGHPTPNIAQPPLVPRTQVTLAALNTNASPSGWIEDLDNETRGNNVDAHTDLDDDNQADTPRPQGNPNRFFDFPLDLTMNPTNYTSAAVVNLFYWNNFVHDKLWELGFTEAAGNFQVTNFSGAGVGGDPVMADAQDGAALNDPFHMDNANMATPPDGFSPRMQMYLFGGPNPDRDGDYDAEVMCHEYTHGLSWRLVGGGPGIGGNALQTHGMGEGWSDFYGLSLLSDPSDNVGGNYASGGYAAFELGGTTFQENYYFGIRRYPYSTNLSKNPLTFKDIDPAQQSLHPGVPRSPLWPTIPAFAAEVHFQGEVWCVTLWEMRANLIAKYGALVGNRTALQLVTDGMKLGPADPNFLQARDAIILADNVNNGGANYAEIWRAFAKRGMGASATSPDSSTTRGVVESFDFPGLSIFSVVVNDSLTGNGNGTVDVNECADLIVRFKNNSLVSATAVSATIFTTTPGVTIIQNSSVYPNMAPGGTAAGLTPFRIYTSPSFVCGTPIRLSIVVSSVTTEQKTATNVYNLRSGFVSLTPNLYNNSTPVNIPDANTNGIFSSVNVAGFDGAIGKVTVSLHITHPFDGDLLLELIGPDGTTVPLARGQGGFGDNFGIACSPFTSRTTFDDNATTSLDFASPPYVGTFRPEEPLAVFSGLSGGAVNGAWRLHVADGGAQDVGTLQCWTLALYPTVCTPGAGPCSSDVGLSATASPEPGYVGLDLTYNVVVTNNRPFSAAGVLLTNVLPANVSFVSASSSQGACSLNGGMVLCSLGSISGNATATATVVVRPNVAGSLNSVFMAGSSTVDASPANNSVSVISTITEPAAAFVAAGAQVVTESFSPPTGGIEAGETVTLNFTLRNTGPVASGNLIATLQEGNGVSAPVGPQTYGSIAPGGTGTAAFGFTANVAAGSGLDAVLQLQDGIRNLGTVTFHFTAGGEVTIENSSSIVINPLGAASPYPATINVSGVAGLLSNLRVTFTKLSHSYPDDIDALLVGPRGQKLVLMSDAGGGNSINNRTITFDAAAAGQLPNESTIAAGAFLPTDYDSGTEPSGDIFPGPAPVGALSSSLQAFNSTDPNGTWSLFVHDDGGGDGGSISGGWSIAFNTVVSVNAAANLMVTASVSPNPAIAGETLTYTLTVANTGPSNATSVVLSDLIPANSSYVSADSTQGTVSFSAGVLTGNLGTIPAGGAVTVHVRVTPNGSGSVTNIASAIASSSDLDLSNNTVTTILNVNDPVADLAVLAVAAPPSTFISSNVVFTLTVTNRGPNRASGVQLTSVLSPSLSFVSVTNSQGTSTQSAGVVTSDLGSLSANGSATVIVTAAGVSAGIISNGFSVAAVTSDPVSANNATNVAVTINPQAPLIVASGSALAAENPPPGNNSIDSGETVVFNFGLRNIGTADTTDLVATLLSSGGVSSPSGPQSYGAVVANGATVSRSFGFVVNGAPGTTLTATLQLQDGAQSLGTVAFMFTVADSHSFTNGNVILIPNQGVAGTYPSTTLVSGLTGTVSKVTVTVRELTHSFPEDIDMLLVGPGGQKVMLMSDAGAGNSISGVTLTFADSAASLPFSAAISSGTFHPTDYQPGETLTAPAPVGPYGTNLSAFNGANPNGTWSLYVMDDAGGDNGRIDGGWTLNIETGAAVANAADVAVSVNAPSNVQAGVPFSYVVTVSNYGPAPATGVTLADLLPGNFTLASVTVSQGSFTTSAGSITANLGTLNVGVTATVTISGSATSTLTNSLVVSAAQVDPNPANNSASIVTSASAPKLNIRLAGSDAVITWLPVAGFNLESSGAATGPFAAAGLIITNVNGTNHVTVPATGTKFYRLRK